MPLAIRKQSCGLICAHDERSRTFSARFPESHRPFCNILQCGRSFLYWVFHSNRYFPKQRLFLLKPDLKLGQHLADGRIVSVNRVVLFRVCLCTWSPTRSWRLRDGICLSALASCNSNWKLFNHLLILRPIADTICQTLLEPSSLRHWHFYKWEWRRPSYPEDISTDNECCSELLSTHSPEMNLMALPSRLKLKIKSDCFKEKKDETKHGNFCKKFGLPKFLLLPKKSELPKIWGGGGRGVLQPPSSNGTYAYGCYHLFFQLNSL